MFYLFQNDSITPINEIQIGASKVCVVQIKISIHLILLQLPDTIGKIFQYLDCEYNFHYIAQFDYVYCVTYSTKYEIGKDLSCNDWRLPISPMYGLHLSIYRIKFVSLMFDILYHNHDQLIEFDFRGLLLIKKVFDSSESSKNLYHCLFPAASSAWFVQYVISSIFLNPLEIMRLADLSLYILNCIIYPRTEAEFLRARIETNFDFNYASSYPRFLLIFTIVTTYSIACPIIAPFGMYCVWGPLCELNHNIKSLTISNDNRSPIHDIQVLGRPLQYLLPVLCTGNQSTHTPDGHHVRIGIILLSTSTIDRLSQFAYRIFIIIQTIERMFGCLTTIHHFDVFYVV